jgi:hypothetical protein
VAQGSTAARWLCNVIEQLLWFPSDGGGPAATNAVAWSLIHDLVVKEPQKQIGSPVAPRLFFLFLKIILWCLRVTADTTNDLFFTS